VIKSPIFTPSKMMLEIQSLYLFAELNEAAERMVLPFTL
jgi:hypothetical protein